MSDLLTDLVSRLDAVEDRHQEYHITCPVCGHPSSPRSPHCSFSVKGWKCFSCGSGGSLVNLAKLIGVESNSSKTPHFCPQEPRRAIYSWQDDPDSILRKFESHKTRYELWNAYKPLSRQAIDRNRLGVGMLPSSRCQHERLIVPILDGTLIVGFRGRQLWCNCGKWLASGGTVLENLPLYNARSLHPGCVVWIVENTIDALMITERTLYVGVAIYSTSYWRDAWMESLKAISPQLVVVALDNDLVGNGGAYRRGEFVQLWKQSHPVVPEARGIKLVNRLLSEGVPAMLYDWKTANYKADIGSTLMAMA